MDKSTITWERIAIFLMTMLGSILIYSSHAIQNSVGQLNSTMIDLRVELGKSQMIHESTREWLERLSHRVNKLERK